MTVEQLQEKAKRLAEEKHIIVQKLADEEVILQWNEWEAMRAEIIETKKNFCIITQGIENDCDDEVIMKIDELQDKLEKLIEEEKITFEKLVEGLKKEDISQEAILLCNEWRAITNGVFILA